MLINIKFELSNSHCDRVRIVVKYGCTIADDIAIEVKSLKMCYKKLWKILIDKDMYKKDLREACGLSTVTMTKLSKGMGVNTDILLRICTELQCDISDICEAVVEDS